MEKNFKSYLVEKQQIDESLALMIYAMDFYDQGLNESDLNEMDINKFLSKFGLKFHKEGPGLIDYVRDFVKGTGKLFVAAVKGDKAEVMRIAASVTKEQVLDFILKLDQATMHILTGPIHFVDAVTGWDLWANMEKLAKDGKDILVDIWNSLKELKKKIHKAFDPNRETTILKQITDMEAMIPKPVTVKV